MSDPAVNAAAAPEPVVAIVLAAGKGTRMKSKRPKVLHEACGAPLLAWPIEAAVAAGADRVVVVVGHGADDVTAVLDARYPGRAETALQAEQRGTGHAAQMALPALAGFSGTALLLCGDAPLVTSAQLAALLALRREKNAPLALWTAQASDPTGYGRIIRDVDGALLKIVEQKDATPAERALSEVNPGVYAVDVAFLREALSGLTDQNAQGELYLTDIVAVAVARGHVVPSLSVDFDDTRGVNDRVQLAHAHRLLRDRLVQQAQLQGATFIDPHSVQLDKGVVIGSDVVIGANVCLGGATVVEDGARIEHGAVVRDTVVKAGAVVHAYSVCDQAVVGEGALVGPFARLRPGAVLEEQSHVGNFVELKKTRLGKGSKANHLAYLGDSDIGAGCNIGAGTITCNYDGIGKHKTVLGDDVFIGSNATLVAPLTVGNGAYVAAASVVTREVPADSLAIARAKQENKDGYAGRIRARNAARAGKKA